VPEIPGINAKGRYDDYAKIVENRDEYFQKESMTERTNISTLAAKQAVSANCQYRDWP